MVISGFGIRGSYMYRSGKVPDPSHRLLVVAVCVYVGVCDGCDVLIAARCCDNTVDIEVNRKLPSRQG